MGKKKRTGSRRRVNVLPDIFETYRRVSRGNLPAGDEGRGGGYDHKVGERKPVILSEMRDGRPCAWVAKGTGDVVVIVQLFLVKAGGQGVPSIRADKDGLTKAHYEFWVTPEAVPIANGHEESHRDAVVRQYDRFIAPLLDRVEEYREPRAMTLAPGKTEAECRKQLERYIDWERTLSEYRLACTERDSALDKEVDVRFGTMDGFRQVTESETTDHLVVPYPVPAWWLVQPSDA